MRLNFAQQAGTKPQLIYLSLIMMLVVGALTGGGARADIQSLLLLRPLTIVACGIGLWHLRTAHIRQNQFLFVMAALIFILPLIQLIPLPTALSGMLAENRLIHEIETAAGIRASTRPISLVPHGTWNAWYSLFGPLAILLLAVQLPADKTARLIPVILAIGVASGLLGVLQLLGPADSALYLYRITNFGKSVGLFANRNHHAVMLVCLLPMFAVYAARFGPGGMRRGKTNWRPLIALVACVLVLPAVLLTGSRGGLLTIPIGLFGAYFCFFRPQTGMVLYSDAKLSRKLILGLGLSTLALCVATLWTSQSSAITRLAESDSSSEFRYQMWQPIMQQAWQYLPFGSGLGSFVEAFQIAEPNEMLTPTYVNHAHNDWLELAMTAGIFGILLLAASIIAWLRSARLLISQSEDRSEVFRAGQAGAFILLILAMASIADYPLRVPSIAFLAVIATVWVANAVKQSSPEKHAGEI